MRFKEHLANLRHDIFNKYALAKHSHLTSHQICMDKAKIIVKEEHLTRRKLREKIEIKMTNC